MVARAPHVSTAPRSLEQEIAAGPSHLKYKGWTDVGPHSGKCGWDVLLNTIDLFSPLPFSPWRAARTRCWKAKIKSAFKSNSIPLFHISPPVIPLQLPAFNPAPVFSAYKAYPGTPRLNLSQYFWVLRLVSPYEGCSSKTWTKEPLKKSAGVWICHLMRRSLQWWSMQRIFNPVTAACPRCPVCLYVPSGGDIRALYEFKDAIRLDEKIMCWNAVRISKCSNSSLETFVQQLFRAILLIKCISCHFGLFWTS